MTTPPLSWSISRRDGSLLLWFTDNQSATLVTLPADQARVLATVVVALVGEEPRPDSSASESP